MSTGENMSSPNIIANVYDNQYKHFWSKELSGDRLEQEIHALTSWLPQIKGNKRIIDFGAGFGRISNALSEKGFEVIGVEISDELRQFAQKEANEKGLGTVFIGGDWEEIFLGEPAAAVLLCGAAYGHKGEQDFSTLRKAHSLLVDGGALF